MKFGQILVWLITNISNMFTVKYTSSYRKHRYELVDEREKLNTTSNQLGT